MGADTCYSTIETVTTYVPPEPTTVAEVEYKPIPTPIEVGSSVQSVETSAPTPEPTTVVPEPTPITQTTEVPEPIIIIETTVAPEPAPEPTTYAPEPETTVAPEPAPEQITYAPEPETSTVAPEPEQPSAPVIKEPEAPADDSIQAQALAAHNEKRARHGAPPLVWDNAMADFAKSVSSTCVFKHSGGPYGENLAAGYSSVAAAIEAWYDEESLYNYSAGQFSSATGHFTQMVWKGATKIGCACVPCNNQTPGDFLTCNYDTGM